MQSRNHSFIRQALAAAAFVTLGGLGAGLAGCQEKSTAEKTAEQNVDRAEQKADQMRDAADKVADRTKDTADRAADRMVEGAERAQDRVEAAMEPNEGTWRSSWDRWTAGGTDARWDGTDWRVERGTGGEITAAPARTPAPTGTPVDDATITSQVKQRLAADSDVKDTQIDVTTANGVVTLSGNVTDNVKAGEAVRIALGTRGVTRVVARLTKS